MCHGLLRRAKLGSRLPPHSRGGATRALPPRTSPDQGAAGFPPARSNQRLTALTLLLALTTAAVGQTPCVSPPDPLPISLPCALRLAGARALDIRLAAQRIEAAAAQLDRARAAWLPTLAYGVDYFRHDGQIQDVVGNVFGTSKDALMVGAGPTATLALGDALFGPLAARQVVRAREAQLQAATNDTLLAVALAYFDLQQTRGELAGASDAAARAADVARRAGELASGGLVPDVEVSRARAEWARRRQAVEAARERREVAAAELRRLLRLDPAVPIEPQEPADLTVAWITPTRPLEELLPIAQANRPELAAGQALVQAAYERLRQARVRPVVPSVLLRGASTNPAGTLGAGLFGGGVNDNLGRFGARSDFDVQLLWELRNLGFGDRALARERRAEHEASLLEALRTRDRVAAEVSQALAQARSAAARLEDAREELREASESVRRNVEGLGQTQRAAGAILLVIRPQEVLAAVQALAQAYADYFGAVGDFNRAEFRLYRALGQPAQLLTAAGCAPGAAPPRLSGIEPLEP